MSRFLYVTLSCVLGVATLFQAASAQPANKKEAIQSEAVQTQVSRLPAARLPIELKKASEEQQYPLGMIADPRPSPALAPDMVMAQIELAQRALKVTILSEYRQGLRRAIAELRLAIADDQWPFSLELMAFDSSGNNGSVVLRNRADAMLLLQKLEADLSAASDMAQLAQIDLQDAMQRQQQVTQMISNIMKSQHDTMKSTIQNLK